MGVLGRADEESVRLANLGAKSPNRRRQYGVLSVEIRVEVRKLGEPGKERHRGCRRG